MGFLLHFTYALPIQVLPFLFFSDIPKCQVQKEQKKQERRANGYRRIHTGRVYDIGDGSTNVSRVFSFQNAVTIVNKDPMRFV